MSMFNSYVNHYQRVTVQKCVPSDHQKVFQKGVQLLRWLSVDEASAQVILHPHSKGEIRGNVAEKMRKLH